ncbi:senescence/dehydration-associated protein At4g35985, chloroplastic [Cannabis sativa]|uniref:senescence/dehydration-associated protein At4g35985, chloroplastic n=1 Tax=Cannabis sativa TaxID=3483 RepID=UPI0029CA90CE|nr:senescence/dehydration-associated protein At4g35985, chloroplastic [Cannabis sativa]
MIKFLFLSSTESPTFPFPILYYNFFSNRNTNKVRLFSNTRIHFSSTSNLISLLHKKRKKKSTAASIMGCFNFCNSKNPSPAMKEAPLENSYYNPEIAKNIRHEILLQIPVCRVHLVEAGEALELANGDFKLTRILDENVSLATIVSVGNDLTWPLTKDEPVVKLDSLNYLFSLPMTDGDPPLSYGVSFPDDCAFFLTSLDSFLKENTCFSGLTTTPKTTQSKGLDWKEFAPRVENYNNFLAKAIAGGTGHIVKGMFKLSNAYANQVQKGGEMTLANGVEVKSCVTKKESGGSVKKSSGVNKGLKRARKMSKMTERLSKTMLNGVGIATGAVMAPMLKSQAGKKFLTMVPGEVILATLDAVNKVLDAAEVAEKQALSATSVAATRMVSNRYGDEAGEATADALATVGHCAGTAWNIFKIRKALNPASSVSTGMLKNAAKSSTKI